MSKEMKEEIFAKFDDDNEAYIKALEKSVYDKARYNLRQVIGIADRIRAKAYTGKKNEYGDNIEDWEQVSTNDMINALSEAAAWNFFSTPIKMKAFIESSLAEIIYKDEYNQVLSSPDLTGTANVKTAIAEIQTQESQFALQYRKLYTKTVEEYLHSFETFVKRLESIVWMRQRETAANPSNPFKG